MVSVPRNVIGPHPSLCQVCGAVFCKHCGEAYVCRSCLNKMENEVKQRILQINIRFARKSSGWIAMIVIGAIIIPFALLGLVYVYQFHSVYQPIAAIIVAVILGIGFIMGGSGNVSRLKKEVREKSLNVLSTASIHETEATNTEFTRPASMPRPTSIPSSAFVPSPQGGSVPRQDRMPSTAFIPSPGVSHGSSPRSNTREVPKEISSPFQDSLGRICSFCGAPYPTDPETRFCPNCGHLIS